MCSNVKCGVAHLAIIVILVPFITRNLLEMLADQVMIAEGGGVSGVLRGTAAYKGGYWTGIGWSDDILF
jgi:cytochrome c biogenesis protein ResB